MSTVLLVEDEAATRRRIAQAIEAASDLALAATAESVDEAREALCRTRPDVLLTDLGLPDGSGVELIQRARYDLPKTRSLVITVFGDERTVMQAIHAGAAGYILKDATADEITEAVRDLLAGGSPISPSIARYLLRHFQDPTPEGDPGLTGREREVLDLVARGFNSPEIAKLLSLSPHTVKTHVRHLYEKLEVTSRGEAVYQAARRGLLPVSD